jgi:hypothetical protein
LTDTVEQPTFVSTKLEHFKAKYLSGSLDSARKTAALPSFRLSRGLEL